MVERKHSHLLKVAKGLFFQSLVPNCYWGECVLTATYPINICSLKVLHVKTPYKILFGRSPSYSSLRTFGCLYCCSILSHGRGKFDPEATK